MNLIMNSLYKFFILSDPLDIEGQQWYVVL